MEKEMAVLCNRDCNTKCPAHCGRLSISQPTTCEVMNSIINANKAKESYWEERKTFLENHDDRAI